VNHKVNFARRILQDNVRLRRYLPALEDGTLVTGVTALQLGELLIERREVARVNAW
jgi:hypothetical protein